MPRYRAYGLTLESELDLPELQLASSETAEGAVQLRRGQAAHLAGPISDGSCLLEDGSGVVWTRGTCLLVRRGEEIIVDAAEGQLADTVRMMIYGRCFGILFLQRRQLVLHASAVARDGEALLFAGRSGAGKSTTAAELYVVGASLLGDDLAPLQREPEGRIVVAPGFPRLKLTTAGARRLGFEQREPSEDDETFYPAERGFAAAPLPVGRIYLLDRYEPPSLAPLSPRDGCAELLRCTFASNLIEGRDALSQQLARCADVAEATTLRRLCTGDGLADLEKALRLVEEDLAGDR